MAKFTIYYLCVTTSFMFIKNLLLCFILFCAISSYAQLPTSGLVAWYPFCGNTFDKSGNGPNLTLSGPQPATDRFGVAEAAYHFNGTNTPFTNIIYNASPLSDTADFTYAIWVNADTGGNSIALANGNIAADGAGIVISGHNVAVTIGGSGTYLPAYLPFHEWHHIVLRRSGTVFSMFMDTVILGAFTAAFTPTPITQPFAIGQDYSSGSRPFMGRLDDIAIYNRALPDADIRALYHFNPDVHAILGPDAAVCAGFSTTLSPSPQYPGLSYVWSTGATDTSIVADTFGSYWFTITRPYGCSTSDTINFTLGIVSVTLGRDTSVCIGDTFTIIPVAPAGSTFMWSTGDTTSTLSVTVPGTYSVTIDNAGCPGYDTINFANSPIPIVSLGPDTSLCSVLPLVLSSSQSYTSPSYLWNTGATTASINPVSSGSYILRVLQDGCAGYDTIVVHFKPNPIVLLGPDRSGCQGDSLTLTGSGATGTIYLWSTGDTVNAITIKNTGTYWLTANDSGCVATDTMRYNIYPYPTVHLGPDLSVCQGTTVTLKSSDTYISPSYSWSTGATSASINVTSSGIYSLFVTENGCTSHDDIVVTIKPNPIVTLGNDTYFCSGSSITLSSVQPAGATYQWSTGANTNSIVVSTAGLYGVLVNLNGCYGADSIFLDEITVPSVNLGPDTTICQGYSFDLGINGDRATYMWSDGSMGTSFHVNMAGPVWASVTNLCGVASDTINVRYKFCDIWLPTAFSPNGDGKNDILRVKGSLGSYTEYHFAIFNRWGVNIFATDDINAGWDGNYNNEPQAIGTYFYMMSATLNGQTYNMTGDFELVR